MSDTTGCENNDKCICLLMFHALPLQHLVHVSRAHITHWIRLKVPWIRPADIWLTANLPSRVCSPIVNHKQNQQRLQTKSSVFCLFVFKFFYFLFIYLTCSLTCLLGQNQLLRGLVRLKQGDLQEKCTAGTSESPCRSSFILHSSVWRWYHSI